MKKPRLAIVVEAPPGKLGLEIEKGSPATDGFIKVKKVFPTSPVAGTVFAGDWISRVNNVSVKDKTLDFMGGLILGSQDNPKRFINILREGGVATVVPPPQGSTGNPIVVTPPSVTKGPTPSVPVQTSPQSAFFPVAKTGIAQTTAPYYDVPAAAARPVITPSLKPEAAKIVPKTQKTFQPIEKAPPVSKKTASVKKPSPIKQGLKRPHAQLLATSSKKNTEGKPKKKKKKIHSIAPLIAPEEHPPPGFVCRKKRYYATKNNETVLVVAEKLGAGNWRDLATAPENTSRFGTLHASTAFKAHTLVYFDKSKCSKWRLKQLSLSDEVQAEECVTCGKADDSSPMLLCDGCDARHHVKCAGLKSVPEGDWFCPACLEVLRARRDNPCHEGPFQLSPLPALKQPCHELERAWEKLRLHLIVRRELDMENLIQYQASRMRSLQYEEEEISRRTIPFIERQIKEAKQNQQREIHSTMNRLGLIRFSTGFWGGYIELYEDGERTHLDYRDHVLAEAEEYPYNDTMSERWNAASALVDQVQNSSALRTFKQTEKKKREELEDKKKELRAIRAELKVYDKNKLLEQRELQVRYASLLVEPQLEHESNAAYKRREPQPRYMGAVKLATDEDVLAINMLTEPDELILIVPMSDNDDSFEPHVCCKYGIFARSALFDKQRDDELSLDRNGVRDAQRRLFDLLVENDANEGLLVTRPTIPPTVRLRENKVSSTHCFDLSALVQDCNVDLDLPREPTPPTMASNGLELRDYQQSSLRWMLDKEKETTGLGLAGQLWHRLRFLDPAESNGYFYCELTGTFALDIFDYRADTEQKGASLNRFAMPTGGVLGEEMGLGKTVEAISLILSNPPPLNQRVLPREHIWAKEKKTVDHPEYTPLPNVGFNAGLMSNATLIVVPMTLLSQWQTEIERFAPQLSFMTLHKAENPTALSMASHDVVIASSSIFSHGGSQIRKLGPAALRPLIKRIHWHRVIIDEAHYDNQGENARAAIAALSATHRISVTGTPVGSQLNDLYGQIRFLRVAPFDRPTFWKNNIEEPYYDRNPEALRVLRSFLSHVIIRHSKAQTFENGKSLLALPPRTVETVLVDFGSESEKKFYNYLETRNRKHFMELRKESIARVSGNYASLIGMLTASRQACSHASMVSIEKIHNANALAELKKDRKRQAQVAKTRAGILRTAIQGARPNAKTRMKAVIEQFQKGEGEMLECPVCLEPAGETDIVMPACAHPICALCMDSLLDQGSSTHGDASGHCPSCRDIMRRSEVVHLGLALDACAANPPERHDEEDVKPPAVLTENGFEVTLTDVHLSVSGADTLRAGRTALTENQLARALKQDKKDFTTLDENFITTYYDVEAKAGTKVTELLQEVKAMTARDPKSKCVVFSQFTGVLDVAAEELKARSIAFVRLDGSLKQHERADALLEFSTNPTVKVFLLSMRAGSVGLTLTAADHCFILDIAQNSAIEEQAIDRIHRIGQTRPVTVKRFVMRDTVEERLLGVRRSLAVDKPSTGTQICGATVMAAEENEAKKALKSGRGGQSDTLDSAKRQMRYNTLEKLFGCSGNVHLA